MQIEIESGQVRKERWFRKRYLLEVMGIVLFVALTGVMMIMHTRPLQMQIRKRSQPIEPKRTNPDSHSPLLNADHLIIVAGHTVFTGRNIGDYEESKSWYLETFQYGQLPFFLEHIQKGIDRLKSDDKAILIYSGGQSRRSAGPRSEAQSYWSVAEFNRFWTGDESMENIANRVFTEEFARDSFENLLFSLCRFREITGRYPERISLISLPFKRRRFVEVHVSTVRFPQDRFEFIPSGESNEEAIRNEENVIEQFEQDPFGCGTVLSTKKRSRNPFNRRDGYELSCPEMRDLLTVCTLDTDEIQVPWAEEISPYGRASTTLDVRAAKRAM